MAFSQIFYETPTIVLYSLAAHLPYDFDYTLEAVYAVISIRSSIKSKSGFSEISAC